MTRSTDNHTRDSGKRGLFRTDVTRSLADQPIDTAAAEARLRSSHGVHNINPWGFGLGIALALCATLFALQAALRHRDGTSSPQRSPASERAQPGEKDSSKTGDDPQNNWIDVELEQ